jgi:hypothetical protein
VSTAKAVFVGAAAGLIFVAVVVVLLATKAVSLEGGGGGGINGPIAVGLVLPEAATGAVTLSVLDLYEKGGSGWTVRSISPSTTVVVPGTGGSTLADAYAFGGGRGLADALRTQVGYPAMSWVIVDAAAWKRLGSGASIEVTLTSDVEVFDGSRLYSFERGRTRVPGSEIAQLLDAASYMNGADGVGIRSAVGSALGSSLASAGPTAAGFIDSDLGKAGLSEWLGTLGAPERVSAE